MRVRSARAAFEVTAGLIPGQPMDELTKRWFFTSAMPDEEFQKLYTAANEYLRDLIDPAQRNWVRFDWVWF